MPTNLDFVSPAPAAAAAAAALRRQSMPHSDMRSLRVQSMLPKPVPPADTGIDTDEGSTFSKLEPHCMGQAPPLNQPDPHQLQDGLAQLALGSSN